MVSVDRDVQVYQDTVRLITELARNPIAELIIGYALVEKLQDCNVLGDMQGNLIESGIAGLIAIQQLAPLVPYASQGLSNITDIIGKVAPAAALAGV